MIKFDPRALCKLTRGMPCELKIFEHIESTKSDPNRELKIFEHIELTKSDPNRLE